MKAEWISLGDACPIRSLLDRIGDRWSVLVLSELEPGTGASRRSAGRYPTSRSAC